MGLSGVRVLVTGGAGFIGHHLVGALVRVGARVRVFDDLSAGQASRLEGVASAIELIVGSVTDPDTVAGAVRDMEIVFHQAARVSVPQSIAQPLEYQQTNATGTLNVLEAARQSGVRRVVYAASSSAYGPQERMPLNESMRPNPISPYAVSKLAGEMYCSAYAHFSPLQTVSLRYFNVFGPGQDLKSQYGALMPNVAAAMLRGRSPVVYGDGEQTRDFCYVDNVVQANLLAAQAPCASGLTLNIACGQRVSVNDVVASTNRLLGTHIAADHQPARTGEIRNSLADISLARDTIGYEPQVQFEEGLARTISYYRSLI